MLELKRVSWKNFMSYGDSVSTLDLENMGQVLITGQILDGNSDGLRKSNGSGKSTIPNVILWGLFGRTMHSPNPGDAIVNYESGKDAWVKIEFKNGDYVIRTRGKHNELIFCKEGEEKTLSTNKNQQELLNKELSLDWEIFTSSAFFTQYGKSWLEMADVNRKKALERILRVDRFTYYALAAKKSLESVETRISKIANSITLHQSNINKLKSTIDKQQLNRQLYDDNKKNRIVDAENAIKKSERELNALIIPDLAKIEKTWGIYDQIADKIREIDELALKASNAETTALIKYNDLNSKIQSWNKKQGKQCLACAQDIPEAHVHNQIEPLITELKSINCEALKAKTIKLKERSDEAKTKLRERKPGMTLQEAKSIHNEQARLLRDIKSLKKRKQEIEDEKNPYLETLSDINTQIEDEEANIRSLSEKKSQEETLYKHYAYLYKAYSERNKIKGYVFKEYIPFINQRLNHYLEMLDLNVRVNLTDNLGLTSNMWGYDYQSGGERKRTDVAFMLAAFDFHESKYGRQCNILVLDEVDGRMDDDGIDGLINIIKQELSRKVETILIISHRNQMHDVFDREIKVIKTNGLSHIEM